MEIPKTGFEEDHALRSGFIRRITLQQLTPEPRAAIPSPSAAIPKTLIRYWHDPHALPEDVRTCLNSWDRLNGEGFEFRMFDDVSAAAYIADVYGPLESEAFVRCRHPAMRCDYLRMCFLLAEGGFYVDADDVLLSENWRYIFQDAKLKVQPLCYDIRAQGMLPAVEIWRPDLLTDGRIFYINNDPIAAPANHPILRKALTRATNLLLGDNSHPEIQSTTGPGNFTAALAAHARELMINDASFDFELLRDWDTIAETRWQLSYRGDARNWRNMDAK